MAWATGSSHDDPVGQGFGPAAGLSPGAELPHILYQRGFEPCRCQHNAAEALPHKAAYMTSRWVLVVDDSENSAAMLEIALTAIPDVSILLASSGAEALRILDCRGQAHAIVTDLNMPRMDGYELIRRLREDDRYSGTPIVVVSADTDPATSQRVADLGVAAFFSKPYSPAQVRRTLEQILDGKIQ